MFHMRYLIVSLVLALAPLVAFAVGKAEVRQELERVEDLRILLRASVQNLHDARALAVYLKGWGGPDRDTEVEDRFAEVESLYNYLRGVDHGASGLQAVIDIQDENAVSTAQFALVQRARGETAQRVNDFYRRSKALKAALTEEVLIIAKAKTQWTLTSEPLPWNDAERERGRQEGLRYGWLLDASFFTMPEADQDYQLAKVKRMGVSFVNLFWDPAVNWADVEKTEGVYDFVALDAAIARLAKYGMTVAPMLRTLTGTPPAWAITKFGADAQFAVSVKDRQETRVERKGINLIQPAAGTAYARFLAAYAAHLKAKWPAAIDAVYLEGGQKELDAIPDESAVMDAYWRAWSKSDTPWRTPETLRANLATDEAAIVKAEQCREAWLLDYLRRARASLKQGWAELRVQTPTFSDDFHRIYGGNVGNSRDAYALTQLTDNPNTATDNPACFAEVNSFGEGRWVWQTGIHSGCGITGSAASMQPPLYDAIRVVLGSPYASMRAYFPGNWNRYCDWQIGDNGIGSYYFSPRRAQEFSTVLANTALVRPEIGILWSQATLRRDPDRSLWRSTVAMGHLLRRSYYPFEYVPEERLAERLKGYKILILSDTQSLSQATCEAIREWVRAGGNLLAFGAPGLFDENGAKRAGLPLADVLGADLDGMRTPAPLYPDKLYTGHPEGAFTSPAPLDFQYKADLTAVLKVTDGKARAWYADAEKQPAIVEHDFGQGKTLWCGDPVGFLYRESAPYEFAYGLSHQRTLSYNFEQNRYEEWMVKELSRFGASRPVFTVSGRMLRAQLRDDGDWFHITTNGPKYREYNFEDDRPARTVTAVARTREGVNNLYLGLLHTEANYFWERGCFRSTLAGGFVTASAALPAQPEQAKPVVFDVRLHVPVPVTMNNRRAEFATWLPAAQASMFAVAPDGNVRLFGDPVVRGEDPDAVAQRTVAYESDKGLAAVEFLDAPQITAFLAARAGKPVTLGYGDPRFMPAAEALAKWLTEKAGLTVTLTGAGRHTVIRKAYMDGFGYNQVLDEPVAPDILVGNTQDNGLMFRFVLDTGDNYWLPLEVNQDFPGPGRALVMLSQPVLTHADGKPGGKPAAPQLVIGASYPEDASRAVAAVTKLKVGR